MIKSERQLVYLDEVKNILNETSAFDYPTLMMEYMRCKIELLHTVTLSDMEDKDIE